MSSATKRGPWQIWGDVIFALFIREIRIGFSDKLGISWAVVNPLLFIIMLSFIRGRIDGGEVYSLPTFVFMACGLVLIQTFLDVLSNASGAVKKSRPLLAFRQVQPISPVIAATLFQSLVKVFVVLGIVIFMFLLGIEQSVDRPLEVILVFCCLILLSSGLGLFLAIVKCFIPEVQKVQGLITRPLFFISGVFFSLKDIPKEYWWLLDWNPILHGIELTRYFVSNSYGNEGVSLSYLLNCSIAALFLGFAYYQVRWKQAVSS